MPARDPAHLVDVRPGTDDEVLVVAGWSAAHGHEVAERAAEEQVVPPGEVEPRHRQSAERRLGELGEPPVVVVRGVRDPFRDVLALRGAGPVSYTHLTLPTIYSV